MDFTQVAVVGGGAAGTAAAITAAELGLDVTLIDEHPVDVESMAYDVPLFFGQRTLGTVADRGSMFSRIVATNPRLQLADEAEVSVHPGVAVWDSAFNNTLTLADDSRSWRLRYDRAIFASGARDLCLPFSGWDKAGVMGAAAALSLINRYQAFAGRRIAILGSGDVGLALAQSALDSGVEVVGVVDVAPGVRGRHNLRESLGIAGVPFYPNHTVLEALGGEEVEGLAIAELDGDGEPVALSRTELRSDTVCFAIGLVSNVDLLYWTGCELDFRPQQGELVPRVNTEMRTTRPEIFAVGDCAGFNEGRFETPEAAEAQGALAAIAAARDLGAISESEVSSRLSTVAVPAESSSTDLRYRHAWYRSMSRSNPDLKVCLCEDVTREDIANMIQRGPKIPDHVKRLTRGGMGHCQGRRCREAIQMIVAEETRTDLDRVQPASYRPPFRPVSLDVVQNRDLTDDEREFVQIRWHHRRPTEGGRSVEAS